jgi:hypothetical protein
MSERRLTTEELSEALQRARAWTTNGAGDTIAFRETAVNEEAMALDVEALVAELRQRRAADLSADEREALEHIIGNILRPLQLGEPVRGGVAASDVAVLAKLTGGGR